MQNTSQTWKDLWASGTAILEARAVIAGTVYTDMPTAPVVNRALMQNGLSIGNAVSATCQLSVRTNDAIPKSAEVVIQYRLTDGATASEWLTAGTFYISHRQRDPVTGVVALVCYDALLKANMAMPLLMPWTTKGGQVMTTRSGEWLYLSAHYPRSMAAVLNDLLLVLGLELDPATQIAEGDGYTIDDVTPSTTINNVLGKIAAANGGNWIMTPAGKLKLVPVVSASGAAGATANVVDVDGIVGGIGVSNTGTITGIRYGTEDGQQVAGDETGLVIDADVTQDVATALLSQIGGMTYQAYELRGAVYDPAAELGDYVRAGAGGEVRAVLCAETATLGPGFTGDISAPEIGEMADEYPYVGTSATILGEAMAYAETAAQAAANALDRTLTQQEVFDRLTDGGAEQGIALEPATNPGPSASTPQRVVLNLDYARFGKLVADFIHGGTLTLGGSNNTNGRFVLLDANGDEVGHLDNGGMNLLQGNIDLDSTSQLRFAFDGEAHQYALFNSDGLQLRLESGAWIYTSSITHSGSTLFPDNVPMGCLASQYDNQTYMLESSVAPGSLEAVRFPGSTSEYTYSFSAQINSIYLGKFKDDGTGTSVRFSVDTNTVTPLFEWTGRTVFSGDFTVSGTKSRVVETEQYSDRLLYCYETPTPMFGDVGEGKIGEDGRCYIWLDPVFAQTITTTQYQVFLQPYGDGRCWVAERKGSYFVVEGTPGMAFGWELKAKQRDYDQRRLERNDEPFTVPTQNYGADAAKHLQDLKKARISK